MKRITAQLALILLVFTLVVPGFAFAQQTSSGTAPTGTRPGTGIPGRRGTRAPSAATAAIERDFDEALKLIEEQYVEGRKLNYNDVFKSSIIGMLRSLDPHSNYYDKEEFDELKTDQRSEYLESVRRFRTSFAAIRPTPSSPPLSIVLQRARLGCAMAIE